MDINFLISYNIYVSDVAYLFTLRSIKMLTFENIYLACIADNNYAVNKMEKVAEYLIQRVESAQSDEDFRQIQSQVRIIILTMLSNGSARLDKKVVDRYNKKTQRELRAARSTFALALGAGTEICIFDVVPSEYIYIINNCLNVPDKQTCIDKLNLAEHHPKLAKVAFVTFDDDIQIQTLFRLCK
jgi:hypothetical protein